jgi:hypothetical protein
LSATISYSRPKSATVNATGMALTLKVAEKPDSPGAIGGTGTTAQLDCRVQADADESGGTSLHDLFKIETIPGIASDTGVVTLSVTVTPILGDGSIGTPKSLITNHDQSMDAWQTAAGRARQA